MKLLPYQLLLVLLFARSATAAPFEVPVHFFVLSNDPAIKARATEKVFRTEIDNLNRTFVGPDGKPLARFVFKAFTPFEQIKDSPCAFVQSAVLLRPTASWVLEEFWQCLDPRVVDFNAVNYYLIDSYSDERGKNETISFGLAGISARRMQGAFIDHSVLGQVSLQTHEFGHVFGLDHNWPADNIMGGGLPTSGFNAQQVAIIRKTQKEIFERLLVQSVPDHLVNTDFENPEDCGWDPCVQAAPGRNSKSAGLALKGKVTQSFFTRVAGRFGLRLAVSAWGPGALTIRVNDHAVRRVNFEGLESLGVWSNVHIRGLEVQANAVVNITIESDGKHVWFDDVIWAPE